MLQVILEYMEKFGDDNSARVVFWRYPWHSNYFVVDSYQLEHYFWKLRRENWMIKWIQWKHKHLLEEYARRSEIN